VTADDMPGLKWVPPSEVIEVVFGLGTARLTPTSALRGCPKDKCGESVLRDCLGASALPMPEPTAGARLVPKSPEVAPESCIVDLMMKTSLCNCSSCISSI
jgi:hypothetical protein